MSARVNASWPECLVAIRTTDPRHVSVPRVDRVPDQSCPRSATALPCPTNPLSRWNGGAGTLRTRADSRPLQAIACKWDLSAQLFRARLPPERMPGICPALCCRVRRIGTIDEEDWCQRRLARSCSSPRVGLRPSAHSRFRGFRARARSMAISYAPSRRLAPSIRSASQPDTLRFAWSARTRSHSAVSSGSVTVTVFMSLEQDGTNFVSSRSRVTKAAPLGPPGPGAEDRCEEGRRARPRDSSPGVGVD